MTVAVTESTDKHWVIISGTYAEVTETMEDRGISGSQVISMSHQGTTGSCAVLIKRH